MILVLKYLSQTFNLNTSYLRMRNYGDRLCYVVVYFCIQLTAGASWVNACMMLGWSTSRLSQRCENRDNYGYPSSGRGWYVWYISKGFPRKHFLFSHFQEGNSTIETFTLELIFLLLKTNYIVSILKLNKWWNKTQIILSIFVSHI